MTPSVTPGRRYLGRIRAGNRLFRAALNVQRDRGLNGLRFRKIDEYRQRRSSSKSHSISKTAFRGFANPRALEGNRRDVDGSPEKRLEIMRIRLEELLPELKAINSRELD
jgi:hypothetical protein